MDYPIIFIPGLFGSLGDDVVKGTGKFSFGLAEQIYRPFIEILNSMGYIEGENLLISYYDWKDSVLKSVDKYLSKDIERIKKQSSREKVIIIGHSLGGLLARAYMTYFNPDNVDKVIAIASPNLGAVDAYCFWSGGKLPYAKIEDNILYNGLKLGFILYYSLYQDKNYLEGLRDIFPVGKDLLPSYGYGDYLYWEEDGLRKTVAIENMTIKNSFLNNLNSRIINESQLYIVAGRGYPTNMELMIEKERKDKVKWLDGKPIGEYTTDYGDGTVTTFSTLGNLSPNSIVLEGNHIDILYKSQDYLSTILNKPIREEIKIKEIGRVHVILASDCDELDIVTSDSNIIKNNSIDIRDSRVQAVNLGNNDYWVMVSGDDNLDIRVEAESRRNKKSKIYKRTLNKNYP